MGYGYCPTCGAKGISRERRVDGNDICENGHTYPSRIALGHPGVLDELATLRAETERLKGEVAFFDNRCPRCNSTLGLLHESECPLCNSRAEVDRLKGEVERLREAVEWERECEEYKIWIIRHQLYPKKRSGFWEVLDIFAAASAEVDALLTPPPPHG